MVLEPKPPVREDEKPRFSYKGDFYPTKMKGPAIGPVQFFNSSLVDSASGKLLIFDDGGVKLELDGYCEIWCHGNNKKYDLLRRIRGQISGGHVHSAVVLLVDCRGYGREISPTHCLIQTGQLSEFREFEDAEPIEFDKVRFVLDGVSEFTGSAFVHKSSSFGDNPKVLVNLADYASHLFTCEQIETDEWHKPAPLDLMLRTRGGNIRFHIERQGRLSENRGGRGWETYCVMEFPKMLSIGEITKMIAGVKSFFDFLFQSSLALRHVWVYSSKQVLPRVDFSSHHIRTKEETDLSSVSVPVCWELYFKMPEGYREDNMRTCNHVVKIGFGDFAEGNKNLLGDYLGKFIDVLVRRDRRDRFADFINFWIHCTYTDSPPLQTALSVHFPALEYFAQKKGINTKAREIKVEDWMKSLAEPLGDDCLKFAKDFADYRNKSAVHNDPDWNTPWSSEEKHQMYERLRVLMRFHILNLLQPDHEELNKTLAEKIWSSSWR